jgi:hypothetical protein
VESDPENSGKVTSDKANITNLARRFTEIAQIGADENSGKWKVESDKEIIRTSPSGFRQSGRLSHH